MTHVEVESIGKQQVGKLESNGLLKSEIEVSSVEEAGRRLINTRVKRIRPLVPPQILQEDIPISLNAAQTVLSGRKAVSDILHGRDDRLMVV
ncbi:hypothetical protein FRC17_004431, partial [Serendipita sp. 399]